MKTPPDREDLLDDIFVVSLSSDTEILARTLKEVRYRRRAQRYQGAIVLLALPIAAIALWMTRASLPREKAHDQNLQMSMKHISTAPVAPSMVVGTRLGAIPIIHSVPLPDFHVRTTDRSETLSVIGDDELLALARNQGGVLIREPGSVARLVFMERPDEP
ncbi:MAG: hypothetical protein HYR88_05720 [Verrucomicrobia bacterium]|nr:hypothetical protein [Verrucomicrobiota bacterium]MBI3869004.1 hypothetical protein [Verrucomicrobiota bacterium]